MRVLQLVYSLAAGGAEIHVVDLAREMARQGADVHVVSVFQATDPLRPVLEERLAAAGVGHTNLGKAVGQMSISAAWRYLLALRRFRPDVVHSHSRVPNWINGCLTWIGCPNAKRVCTLHNVNEEFLTRFPANLLKPWKRFHRVICVSDAVREQTMPGLHKSVIPVARDLSPFLAKSRERVAARRELGIGEDEIAILHVGNMGGAKLQWAKNQGALIDAFGQLPTSRRARLLLIGDGIHRQALEERVERAGVQDQILFLGVQVDMARFYALADLFVLPSLWEGFPLAAMEALVAGLPALFAPIASLRQLGDGWTGVKYCAGVQALNILNGLQEALDGWGPTRWRRGGEERRAIAERMGIEACVRSHWGEKGYGHDPTTSPVRSKAEALTDKGRAVSSRL